MRTYRGILALAVLSLIGVGPTIVLVPPREAASPRPGMRPAAPRAS